MAQGDAAAADVEFGFGDVQGLGVAQHLRGEGFVDFEEVDVAYAQFGLFEGAFDALDGGGEDVLGGDAAGVVTEDLGDGFHAEFLGGFHA